MKAEIGGGILESNGIIQITNRGEGNVYGMFSDKAKNAYQEGTNEKINLNIANTGTIDISNYGSGNVYGMYHDTSKSIYGGIYNVYHELQSPTMNYATGNINIYNEGNGNVYGMYSDYDLTPIYDANIKANTNNWLVSNITINNTGSGNSYGLYSQNNISDYFTKNTSSHAVAINKITMTNSGIGKSYGMFATEKVTLSNRGVTEITITNEKAGTVYGIYSNIITGGYDGAGVPLPEITIYNLNNGVSYGKYSETSAYIGAELNLFNLDNGTAIGVFSEDNIYDTSGFTGVYNLGNGLAIGLMAQNIYSVADSAIWIQREPVLNLTPTSERGGVAIGTYVKKDGKLDVQGSLAITIGNADKAYGIFAEENNTISINSANSEYPHTIQITDSNIATGIYLGKKTVFNANDINLISIDNAEQAYGIHIAPDIVNVDFGDILISGTTNAHGVYVEDWDADLEIDANISIVNKDLDTAYGIYIDGGDRNVESHATTNIQNEGTGIAYGIFSKESQLINYAPIMMNNLDDGTVIALVGSEKTGLIILVF